MIIEGSDLDNPVALFLHGGPGFPQYPMIHASGMGWSKEWTICYWDQRGAGMSFNPKTQGPLTLDRYIKDTVEVTNYLRQKFNQDRIYLVGHSWGTVLGSFTASRHPELYLAYIGIGQLGRMYQSNRETYEFLLQTAVERGDRKAERAIRSVDFGPLFYRNTSYRQLLGKYLNVYGGGMKRTGHSMAQGLKELFKCKAYTFKEKLNVPRGSMMTYDQIIEELMRVDCATDAWQFKVPVYIFQGKYDYQTSFNEAVRYYEHVEAPIKEFYAFETCAHSPFLEEQEGFRKILREEVLQTPQQNK